MGRCGSSPSSRSIASAPGRWGPTPSEAHAQHIVGSLKSSLAGFDGILVDRLVETPAERLSSERARIVDEVIRSLFEPFRAHPFALLATGGFGSFDLTPGSDVDLLFVHVVGDRSVEEAVAAIIYPLWDAGLRVSHAVRTPEECETQSITHLESLTAMASARLIGGDQDLGLVACNRSLEVARRDCPGYVRRLRASRAERRERFGALPRLLEPDLKESLGGERDRQLLWWITGALGPIDDEGRLIEVGGGIDGWPRPREVSRAQRAAGSRPPQSVSDVRLALHVVNGAASNRLMAEHHDPVARALRMTDRPGWEARDLLLRWVALAGSGTDRWAGRFLDRIQAQLEDDHPPSIRPRDAAAAFASARPPESDTAWSPLFLQGFLAFLKEGTLIEKTFGEARASLLQSLPEWRAVMGRPQRDPYHRYPVDVHLMETVKEAGILLSAPEEPFAAQAAAAVADRDALLLGALFHDIGKVGRESHVPVGVEIAARALERMGVQGERREDVLFLVADHLLLSDSATRRNIEDEDLVLRVASRIRTPERLGMLYLLTVADAKATGPSACTSWRMNLVRDLVSKVSLVLERRQVDSGRVHRLEAREASVRRALADRAPHDVETFLQSVPTAYLLSVRPEESAIHLDLMKDRPRPDEIRMNIREGPAPGAWVVTVVALDRVGLLADVAGALSISGLSILAAHAFTSERGIALDEFEVRGAFEPEPGADRWDRFRATLEGAGKGDDLEQKLRSVRSHYRRPTANIPVHVRIDQEGSNFYTVVEVEGSDRIGLLSDLARAFARLGVDVHMAKVATYGPRVVDVFYVTDQAGEKLKGAPQVEALERGMREAASAL